MADLSPEQKAEIVRRFLDGEPMDLLARVNDPPGTMRESFEQYRQVHETIREAFRGVIEAGVPIMRKFYVEMEPIGAVDLNPLADAIRACGKGDA